MEHANQDAAKKSLEASKGRLAASRNAQGSFSGRTSTSGPALVITAKGEGGHRKNRRRHRRARAHRTPQLWHVSTT